MIASAQPLTVRHLHVAAAFGMVLALLALMTRTWPGLWHVGLPTLAVALMLVAACVAATFFPIHVRHHTRIHVSSVPLYLMAVLLAPPLAAVSAGAAIGIGELAARRRTGLLPSDIVTDMARWMVLAAAASAVAATSALGPFGLECLALAAAVLWVGDVLTAPLLLCPITGESPGRVMRAMIHDAGAGEAAQYGIALLGALAVRDGLAQLTLVCVPTVLVYVVFKHLNELTQTTMRVLEQMADMVDLRDSYTGGHSCRVAALARDILDELRITGPEADLIVMAARVHDVGKIGIPDAVLRKAGPLTAVEQSLIEGHPEQGAALLRRYRNFSRGVAMVLHHHERWDGGGYPHGLGGDSIPFGARIIAVADSYDATTTDRPYRCALSPAATLEVLRDGRGRQWDPAVVDALIRAVGESVPPLLTAQAASS